MVHSRSTVLTLLGNLLLFIAGVSPETIALSIRDECLAQKSTVSAVVVSFLSAKILSNCGLFFLRCSFNDRQYGYPLVSFLKAAGAPNSTRTSNKIYAATSLSTPNNTAVILPNDDTLYTTIFYDISQDNLEVTTPNIQDARYWSIASYTPYGDNYAILGALRNTSAGRKYLVVPNGALIASINSSAYDGIIEAPTTLGILLMRIVLKDTSNDLTLVQRYQSTYAVETVSREGVAANISLQTALSVGSTNNTAGNILLLSATYRAAWSNPATQPLNDSFSSMVGIDISNGTYAQPSCVNLTSAYDTASQDILDFALEAGAIVSAGNNWNLDTKAGLYGDDYAARAYIAKFGYLILQPTEVLYPSLNIALYLQTNESYRVIFSGKPPISSLGFWSLTLYNTAGFFVENTINRYAIGDRTSLTYPDGQLVYGNGNTARFTPFEVLVQEQTPPANWTGNWLPSPKQPGPFRLILRWYGPTAALSNGTYVYPAVNKSSVVSGNDSPSSSGNASSLEPTISSAACNERYQWFIVGLSFILRAWLW